MLDKLWGAGIGLPRHLMSVCWMLGHIVSPLICLPFFKRKDPNSYCITSNISTECLNSTDELFNFTYAANGTSLDDTNASFPKILNNAEQVFSNDSTVPSMSRKRSPIEYPYIIVFVWTMIPVILLAIFYYHDRTSGQKYYAQDAAYSNAKSSEKSPTWKSIFSPKTCGQGSSAFGTGLIILLCLYYFTLSFKMKPFYEFIMVYATEKIGMTKADAAVMMVVGRGIIIASGTIWGTLTRFVPIQALLFIKIFTELAIVIYFNFVNIYTSGQLYAFIASISVFGATNWAAGITWGLRYLDFSSLVYTFIELSGACGGILSTWVTGYVLEYGGHEAMLRLQLGGNVVLCVVLVVMQVVGSCKGEKFKKSETQKMDDKKIELSQEIA